MFTLNATHEVIVSAGAVQSPHLLQLSGIGDSAALTKAGITPIVSNPSVGKNLQDHVLLTNTYSVQPSFLTLDEVQENATFAAEQIAAWQPSPHKGELVLNACNQIGWFRLPKSVLGSTPDPSAGATSVRTTLV